MKKLLPVVLVSILFFTALDLSWILHETNHSIFQGRDIERALALLKGHLIFFGPEVAGGGNLPGPLYYFILASSLIFSSSWMSPWILMLIFSLIGGLIGWHYFRTRYSTEVAVIWLVLYACSMQTLRTLLVFQNSSYVLMFMIAMLVGALVALVGVGGRTRQNGYFALCLLSGLAIQLHPSSLVLLFAFLLTQALSRVLRVHRLEWPVLLRGAGFFFLPLVPFLLTRWARSMGITWGQIPFIVSDSKKTLPNFFEAMGPDSFTEWMMSLLTKVLETTPWALFIILLVMWLVPVKSKRLGDEDKSIYALLFFLGLCFIPFSLWTLSAGGVRYGTSFSVVALFLTATLFSIMTERPRGLRIYNVLTSLIALLLFVRLVRESSPALDRADILIGLVVVALSALVLVMSSSMQRWRQWSLSFAVMVTLVLALVQRGYGQAGQFYTEPKVMPGVSQWQEIWTQIYPTTGWSFEESIQRIYFVNHHIEQYGRLVYDRTVRSMTFEKKPGQMPDGYIVSIGESGVKNRDQVIKWLASQNLPEEVHAAAKSGELILGEPLAISFLMVPYEVHRAVRIPRYFHNSGEGYRRTEESLVLNEMTEPEGAKILRDGRYLFKWSECPQSSAYCAAGVVVKIDQSQLNTKRLRLTVIGSPISQISPWINPKWTQRWIKPYAKIRCGGRQFHFQIAESVGYSSKYAAASNPILPWGNHSIVAPLKREFEFPCSREPTHLTVGREGSEVEDFVDLKALKAQELSLHL